MVCRSEKQITTEVQEKISNYCHVPTDHVIFLTDKSCILQIPLMLEEQGLLEYFLKKFKITPRCIPSNSNLLSEWRLLVQRSENMSMKVNIALVGKYTKYKDAYTSVIKALIYAGIAINRKLVISFIEASDLEPKAPDEEANYKEAWQKLYQADGLIVPGGFDSRGFEGMVAAIKYARNNRKPFLGICLGFQAAVVEFSRNFLNITDANSFEINPQTKNPVVIEMPEHVGGNLGGTMRVGRRETHFVIKDSRLYRLYNCKGSIHERHRHRYEVNKSYVKQLQENGMRFVGLDTTNERMEIMELDNLHKHPYFVGVQFHPEYTSRPLKPSPPYLGLLLASVGELKDYLNKG